MPDRKLARSSDIAVVRWTFIVGGVGLLFAAIIVLSNVILMFFGAILVAPTLSVISIPLRSLRVSQKLSVALVATTGVAIVAVLLALFGGEILSEGNALVSRLQTVTARVGDGLNPETLGKLFGRAAANLPDLLIGVLSWGMSLGQIVVGVVLVVVGGVYLALEPALYRNGIIKLVPPALQSSIGATIDDIGEALRKWVCGQFACMILVGSITGIGLWAAGVQSPFALGLLAGAAEFIPYVGTVVAAAVTLVAASEQGWVILSWAAAVMFAVQQIESNFFVPIIIGGMVSIAPATGLFAIVSMGVLFGPLGILFGFPLAVTADIAIRRLYVRDTLKEDVDVLGKTLMAEDPSPQPAERCT